MANEWKWYWREEDGKANCGVFFEKRPGQAYSVARCPQFVKKEEWEKYGPLIAAAPELLAALESLLELGCVVQSDAEIDEHKRRREIARAAVAKAKG